MTPIGAAWFNGPVPPPTISVVIPAFNEGARLPRFVERLAHVALQHPDGPAVEFVVSDDGSKDEHAALQRACVDEAQARLTQAGNAHRFVYLAAERNGGKGSAIRHGWRNSDAGAEWLAFIDADGAVSAEEFMRLARMAATSREADVLVGSRILMAGRRVVRNTFRHLQGRVFATLTDNLFRLGFYDTQCGVKFFRASLLRPLLDGLEENRWLLDVELLVRMKQQGARAIEVPIDWEDFGDSKVTPGLDAARMFWGLLMMERRLSRP
ncbi:glycosyltransferase [Myxococcaceae bacterium GXIMD 01537]